MKKIIATILFSILSLFFVIVGIGFFSYVDSMQLNEKNKVTGIVTSCGTISQGKWLSNIKAPPIPIEIDSYVFTLDGNDNIFTIHDPSQNYSLYEKEVIVGDTVTVYFQKLSKTIDYNVYQLSKRNKILVSIDRFKRNMGFMPWVFLGLGISFGCLGFWNYKSQRK